MLRILTGILLSIVVISCNGTKGNKNDFHTSQSQEDSLRKILKIHDSIKILKMEHDKDGNYDIFIDYNRKSDYYNTFQTSFVVAGYMEQFVKEQLQFCTMQPSDSLRKLIKTEYPFLMGIWIELHPLKGDLYVTNSCNFEGSYIVTDSLFYDKYDMDGPELSFFENIEKLSPTKTRLTLKTPGNKKLIIDFYLTNKANETYFVVQKGKFDKDIAFYMTNTKHVRNYDLVQHICTDESQIYEFDKIDQTSIIESLNK